MIARKRESRGPSSISLQEIDPSKRSITTVFESEDVEQETANSNISRTDKARGVDLRPWIDQVILTSTNSNIYFETYILSPSYRLLLLYTSIHLWK